MTAEFFRFPHTPHLMWLGKDQPRDDKVLSAVEVATLLADEVVIEEKLDGANLGLSLSDTGQLQAQNRGQYVQPPYVGQFSKLTSWRAVHEDALEGVLNPDWIAFGEWCAARHSLRYERLPDWWLLFDVYDRHRDAFQSTSARNALAKRAGLATVAEIFRGRTTLGKLETMLSETPSQYRDGPMEGLVVRSETTNTLRARAKLVRPDFAQAIGQHWRSRRLEWNQLA